MSKENVKKMFGKLEKDAEFQKKYLSLMKTYAKENETALTDRLIEFGKLEGFSFSSDDLLAARAELIDKVNANGDLADEDLAKIAGGTSLPKAVPVVFSIFTAGIMCALMSVVGAANTPNKGCEHLMSTQECRY